MNISIFGTGYVGLVNGACLAESGHDIYCVDVDKDKIDLLNSGQIPIYEPGLKDLVSRNLAAERIHFSTDLEAAVNHAKVLMIAVGTPSYEDGSTDLQYVIDVTKTIAETMEDSKIIVTKINCSGWISSLNKTNSRRNSFKDEKEDRFSCCVKSRIFKRRRRCQRLYETR